MVDILLRAFAFAFAELLTITLVTGKPPIKPEVMLPTPCANNSLLVDVVRLSESNLSIASILSKVSTEATIAIVNAAIYTCGLVICEKSGNVNKFKNPESHLLQEHLLNARRIMPATELNL